MYGLLMICAAVAACGGGGHRVAPVAPVPVPAPIAIVAVDAGVDAAPVATPAPVPPPPVSPDQWHDLDLADSVMDVVAIGDTVFALGDLGVWRSDDGGTTWRAPTPGPQHCPRSLVAASGPRPAALWVSSCGPDERAFASFDRGETWLEQVGTAHTVVLADDGKTLWGFDAGLSLARSDDRGKHWRSLGRPNGCGGTPVVVSIATHASWLVCDQDQLFVSTDGGGHWRPPPARSAPQAGAELGDPRIAWRILDEGCTLQRSHDGGASWAGVARRALQNGTCAPENTFRLPASIGARVFAPVGSEILISTDSGAHWDTSDAEAPDKLVHLTATSRALFALANGEVFVRTLPRHVDDPATAPPPIGAAAHLGPFAVGATWTPITGLESEAVFAAGTTIIALGLKDLDPPWVSTDEGRTWTSLPACLAGNHVVTSRADPRQIWISGCFGSDSNPRPPIASHDGGKTFAPVANALGMTIVARDDRGTVFAVAGQKLMTSRDAGTTWNEIGDPDADRSADRIVLGPPGMWAIGGGLALSPSADGGRTWRAAPPWSGGFEYASLESDGRLLYLLGDQRCSAQVSSDAGRTFRPLFSHPLRMVNAGDYHTTECPHEYAITTFALAPSGVPWFVVGEKLQAGTRATALTLTDPLSLAITPHAVVAAKLDGTVAIARLP